MSDPFRGSRLKLSRARRHLAELETSIAQHTAIEVHDTSEDALLPSGAISFGSMTIKGYPEDLGAIVGDIIHNLRAALDLMAVKLVELKGENARKVYFPFADSASALDLHIRTKGFQRAGTQAVALLKKLRPFTGGNIELRAIHDLDIQDKHKTLIPSQTQAVSRVIDMQHPSGKPTFVEGSAPHASYVFPSDSPFPNREIAPTLRDLITLVENVIDEFSAIT